MSSLKSHAPGQNFFMVVFRFLETFVGSLSAGWSHKMHSSHCIRKTWFLWSLTFKIWNANISRLQKSTHFRTLYRVPLISNSQFINFLRRCLQVLYWVFHYVHYFSYQNTANICIIDITITTFFPWNDFSSILVFLILILPRHLNFYVHINITNNALHTSLQVWELDLFLHWYPFRSIFAHTCLCVCEASAFNLSTFACSNVLSNLNSLNLFKYAGLDIDKWVFLYIYLCMFCLIYWVT